MNGLALFAGVGGLELGLNLILPDSRAVCFVEGEAYNIEVLQNKIEKKQLEEALIFSDVRAFRQICNIFSGKVDFITAGFPCQPFSTAGDRKGTKDERWLWGSILEIISQVQPSFLFLENVSNLINEWGAFDEISKSLSKIGFNLEWGTLRASEVGANHHRNRLFIFAYKPESLKFINPILPHSNSKRRNELDYAKEPIKESGQFDQSNNSKGNSTDSDSYRTGENVYGFTLEKSGNERRSRFVEYGINQTSWWENESGICRVVDGVAFGMDRIRACGNGVVPLQAAIAYYELIRRAKEVNQ